MTNSSENTDRRDPHSSPVTQSVASHLTAAGGFLRKMRALPSVGDKQKTPTSHELLKLCVFLYLVFYVFLVIQAAQGSSFFGVIIARDFVPFYTASSLALDGRLADAFVPEVFAAAKTAIFPDVPAALLWLYPPPFALLILPLALAAPLPSFLLWNLFGAAVFAVGCWRLWPSRLGLLIAFSNSAVLACAIQGQNSLLYAGLFALLGAAMLDGHRRTPGMWCGSLLIKPHLALLLPLAFVSGRFWQTFLVAAGGVALFASVATVVFGLGYWSAYAAAAGPAQSFLLTEPDMWRRTVTSFSSASSLGAGSYAALSWHFLVAVVVLLLVATFWMRFRATTETVAMLMAGSLIVAPYVVFYDLVLLSPAVVLLVRKQIAKGEVGSWSIVAYGFAFAVPICVWAFLPGSQYVGFLAPMLVFAAAASSARQGRPTQRA